VTSIRSARPADDAAIAELIALAFGRELEARLVELLRDGGYARVSLVAERDGEIAGHAMFSELAIVSPGETLWALSLAPLAVRPDHQHEGVGSALVRGGMRICRKAGHRIVFVVGEPAFYKRFGFSPELAEPLRSSYAGPHMMAIELVPNALAGVQGELRYPPPFQELFP
jgi:putative acetyltransferase